MERSAGRAAAWLGHESLEPPPKSDLQTRLLRRHPSWEVLVGVVELLTGVCVSSEQHTLSYTFVFSLTRLRI